MQKMVDPPHKLTPGATSFDVQENQPAHHRIAFRWKKESTRSQIAQNEWLTHVAFGLVMKLASQKHSSVQYHKTNRP